MNKVNSIFVFGDSLQDNGNVIKTLGAPKEPYYSGHFSNGPVSCEYLAQTIEKEQKIKPKIHNLAHGGALSSGSNPKSLLTDHALSVKQQVDIFKSLYNRFDKDDLVIIDGGGNNLFFAIYDESPYFNLQAMFKIGDDIAQITDNLIQRGAKRLVVWTVPDVTITPTFKVMKFPAWFVKILTKIYKHQVVRQNKKIIKAVAELRRKYSHVQIELFDAYTFLNCVIQDPATFGIENTVDPCIDSFGGFDLQGKIQENIEINGDPETYLFWDWVHPTTKGHKIMAQEIHKLLSRE
ncbi:MAG: thermolabile hemolysin [Francisellaceae bacterium]|jgi:thermolabile hemolysin